MAATAQVAVLPRTEKPGGADKAQGEHGNGNKGENEQTRGHPA